MSTALDTATTPPAEQPSLRQKAPNSRSRERTDRIMRTILLLTVGAAIIPLVAIILVTAINGGSAINLDFFTQNPPFRITNEGGGYAPAFVGSFYMVGLAMLIAIPTGIAAAIYLVEYDEERFVGPLRFFTDVMTGVPSVFVGLFVYAAIVRDAGVGFGTLPGAIALAILMLPIVVRTSEEVLKLVPDDLRNASYGLGARRWQTVMRVVLPAANSGLVTAGMLAVARAIGETAPLLLTALGAREVILALTGRPQGSLTLQAFAEARTFSEAANARGWAGALSLMVIALFLSILARVISARADKSGR